MATAMVACIGQSPEERARADQGPGEDGDEEHRPGQPCLVCHGAAYHPGNDVFVLAGTVYPTVDAPDDRGLEGVEVSFIDDAGHEFFALTNRVGNFMVEVRSGLEAPQQRARGRLRIPWEPVFPVSVAVLYQSEDVSMESLIWRDGSCAACHQGSEPGVDHVENVSLAEVVR